MPLRQYGIDLGTDTIKIYDSGSDTLIKEKNMLAVRKKKDIIAIGDRAYELYEKVSEE
ncbi:MAG: rod shape-determining protein, partial [Lachnospiraceae bacterium]|nr:rod shape-determining protein [Lachnospiraceae bacterium]